MSGRTRVKVDSITFDTANVRRHDGVNIKAIEKSLKRFGQQKPIVLDKNNIVRAGNGTLSAAINLGWKDIWAVVSNLSKRELTAYAIADNRTAELADWDMTGLEAQLKDLDAELASIAYDDFEYTEDEKKSDGTEDDIPEVDENPYGVVLGDIWQLGEHRLMCGDSTDKSQVDRLMDGEKADMVFTDPPYGINYKSFSIGLMGSDKKSKNQSIVNDDNTDVFRKVWVWLCDYDAIKIIFGANYMTDILPVNGAWLVWNKLKFDKPGQNFSHCELAWTNKKNNSVRMYSHSWDGAVREGNKKDECKTRVHPNQKPVGMTCKIIEDYNYKSCLILDIFLGSGSTLIACEKTHRRCFGSEIDPNYCSVIIERWQKYTGKKAVKINPIK